MDKKARQIIAEYRMDRDAEIVRNAFRQIGLNSKNKVHPSTNIDSNKFSDACRRLEKSWNCDLSEVFDRVDGKQK